MKYISFYSGGLGSWGMTKRIIKENGTENLFLCFTDTFMEEDDTYRFIIETSGEIYKIDVTDLLALTNTIPSFITQMDERKEYLIDLSNKVRDRIPSLIWIYDGRDMWEVFKKNRWLGNSRLAHCTKDLKQKVSFEWVQANYSPEECTLYIGMDWTEEHRKKAPIENWHPYEVRFPMCDEPYLAKEDLSEELAILNIELPILYKLGFSHNNCGGVCVKGGQKHFINLLEHFPERFEYMVQKEKEIAEFLDANVTILTKTRNKKVLNYSLEELRNDYIKSPTQIDMFDHGGCGCFVEY